VERAVAPWFQLAQIEKDDNFLSAGPGGERFTFRIKGNAAYAARKVSQAIGALRKPSGDWEKFIVSDVQSQSAELFISTDKSPAMVKKELGLKQLRKAFEAEAAVFSYFSDKQKGEISANWKPLAK
ncbi:unnamed protein product, partial [Prorocentrum cordatum]